MTDSLGTNPQEERNRSDDPSPKPDDPGAYVGNQPERQAEIDPAGVLPDDERVAAHSTQRAPGHTTLRSRRLSEGIGQSR